MDDKEKAVLLPVLLVPCKARMLLCEITRWVSLQNYPNQKDTVVPLIVNALHDPEMAIRLEAVRALNKIDPQNHAKF